MIERSLDVDAVRAFVHVADTGSFTRCAEIMGTSQSAISLKIQRLETRLGHRLLERTPRSVRLSAPGAIFLERARDLVAAHDRVLGAFGTSRQRLAIGISDHVAGPELPTLISRMNARDTGVLIEIRIGSTGELLQAFDRRELNAAIVRFHDDRDDGKVVTEEKFGWFAASDWRHRHGEPIPVATMPEPCGVRSLAARRLDDAGIDWTEIFVGGGVAAVAAAVTAKLGVAALARRMLPFGVVDVGPALGLPDLPRLPIVLHSRVRDGRSAAILGELSATFRSAARD